MSKSEKIEIPSFFTVDWYISQKELGKTDGVIADELFISIPLLAIWKREVGCTQGLGMKYGCSKSRVDIQKALELKEKGYTGVEIAQVFNVNSSTIYYHFKKLKVSC